MTDLAIALAKAKFTAILKSLGVKNPAGIMSRLTVNAMSYYRCSLDDNPAPGLSYGRVPFTRRRVMRNIAHIAEDIGAEVTFGEAPDFTVTLAMEGRTIPVPRGRFRPYKPKPKEG